MVIGQLLITPTVELCIQQLSQVKEMVWLPYDTIYLACAEPLRRAKYCDQPVCVSVCLSVCLSVREDISGTTRVMFTNFLCMLSLTVAQSFSDRVTKSQGEGAVLGVFFSINNAWYITTFGTHTKTAESIEMPFGIMSGLGPRKCVTWVWRTPKGKEQFRKKACARQA